MTIRSSIIIQLIILNQASQEATTHSQLPVLYMMSTCLLLSTRSPHVLYPHPHSCMQQHG